MEHNALDRSTTLWTRAPYSGMEHHTLDWNTTLWTGAPHSRREHSVHSFPLGRELGFGLPPLQTLWRVTVVLNKQCPLQAYPQTNNDPLVWALKYHKVQRSPIYDEKSSFSVGRSEDIKKEPHPQSTSKEAAAQPMVYVKKTLDMQRKGAV